MPTIILPVENDEIRITAILGVMGDGSDMHAYEGIVDTGAQMTGITRTAAERLGVHAVGQEYVVGIEGKPTLVPVFRIMIGIGVPATEVGGQGEFVSEGIHVSGGPLKVMLLEDWNDDSADVLLGMDMLASFHITMFGGRCILSN